MRVSSAAPSPALLEALNRHRGKGQQKVTVEHVHVHSGGQAVVGLVEPAGGGDRIKLEDQPHARQIADARQPEMRCPLPDDPTGSNAERSMPDARRTIDGGRRRVTGTTSGTYSAEAIAGRRKIRQLVRAMRALARQEQV